ncbi:MAG: hypothetical protein KGN79_13310 [Acidobacteriota bacterium]|nr:hypothetical protein [Acidobacteriota bacterium]
MKIGFECPALHLHHAEKAESDPLIPSRQISAKPIPKGAFFIVRPQIARFSDP